MVGRLPHEACILPLLKRSALFGGLPDDVLGALMHRGQFRKYGKGDNIYRRGDPGDSLMILIAGGLKLTIISKNAKEVVLRFVIGGEAFGEIAALDGNERALNAVALEASEVFVIRARELLSTLNAHPHCLNEIIRSLCAKVRVCALLLEDRTFGMRVRVARGLYRLTRQLGRRCKDGIQLQLIVSQEELGNYLGLARANVSRQLGLLKAANVIKVDGTRIIVTNERALAEFAEMAWSRD